MFLYAYFAFKNRELFAGNKSILKIAVFFHEKEPPEGDSHFRKNCACTHSPRTELLAENGY